MEENIYITLIYKSLKGEISPQETLTLDNWIKASPDNQHIYDQYVQQWELSSNYEPGLNIDVKADFKLLKDRIQQADKSKPNTNIRSLQLRWLTIAASIILLLSGSLWWFKHDSIEFIEVANPGNSPKEVLLSDGSKVWLNNNSSVYYPKTFAKNKRQINMDGEVFFEVTKDHTRPFIVHTSKAAIEVLGTRFNVNAYKNSDKTSVLVETGKVSFSALHTDNAIELTIGQQGILNHQDKNISKMPADKNVISWITNQLIFKQKPLSETFKTLQEQYKVSIEVNNKKLLDCKFTGSLKIKNIDISLDYLKEIYNFDVQKINGIYHIKGGACQ